MYNKITILFQLAMLFSLAGCKNNNQLEQHKHIRQIEANKISITYSSDEIKSMEQCRRELDALKQVNNNIYIKRKNEFDKLISGAGIYTGVRNEVASYTQTAVDAYYQFQSHRLCADISNELLNELARN